MFKSVLSEYIVTGMADRGWKLKDLARESTLPDSTINSYILQKTGNPSEENLLRIVRAFGDPEDTIQQLRQRAMRPAPDPKGESPEEHDARIAAQWQERLDTQAKYFAEIRAEADRHAAQLREENEKVRDYLRTVIRNLSIALVAVSLISVIGLGLLGGYAAYAYHTFDKHDPTQGLYQEDK